MVKDVVPLKRRYGQFTQFDGSVFNREPGLAGATKLFQARPDRGSSREYPYFRGMIGSGVKSSVQRHASRAYRRTALVFARNGFWHQKKVDRCRHAHLNIEPRRVYPVRKADNRRASAVVALNQHVTAFADWLGFEQLSNL